MGTITSVKPHVSHADEIWVLFVIELITDWEALWSWTQYASSASCNLCSTTGSDHHQAFGVWFTSSREVWLMRVGRLSESLFTAFLPSFSEPQRDGKRFKVQECKQPFASSLCRGSHFESKPQISSDVDKSLTERRKQIAISDMTQTHKSAWYKSQASVVLLIKGPPYQ